MTPSDRTKKITVASVALATSGLSSCTDGGAVDPPPPPFECNMVQSQSVVAGGRLEGSVLVVFIQPGVSGAGFATAGVTNITGGTLAQVTQSTSSVEVRINLDDPAPAVVSFTFNASLTGFGACPVTRTFTATLDDSGGVTLAMAGRDVLPLRARQQAQIVLVKRTDREVELEASTPFRGALAVEWSVTGGNVVSREGARLRWQLPKEKGFYQAELVIDYGLDGLSIDTLAFEVS